MIRLIDSKFEFPKIESDCFYTKIQASFNAYGTKYAFAQFWYQEIMGEITAVISRVDGNMTLWCNENWNKEEFENFARAVGFATLTTEQPLRFSVQRSGSIYYKTNNTELCKLDCNLQRASTVFSSVCEIENYNAWYTDINYRIRHNCAAAYCYIGESCVFAHLTDDCALIFSLITLPESRGKGYATKCLDLFERSLEQKYLFVTCEERLNSFYEAKGYDYVNQFYEYGN